MFVRAYLRASSEDQLATRARDQLDAWCEDRGLKVASYYVENESGTIVQRPELMRLLHDAREGDFLLTEQVDRLSRLTDADWQRLRREIEGRGIRIIALDLPTSWSMIDAGADPFTQRMFAAINGMLLDMLAAVARKDYDDRRRRQAQGIARAKADGLYRGRREDTKRNSGIEQMLSAGMSYRAIQASTLASPTTIAKISARMRADKTTLIGPSIAI